MAVLETFPLATGEPELIEEFGVLFEQLGLTRMAGRIFGALLLSEEAQLSAAALSGRLSASAGSISGTTRQLLHFGLIERVSMRGDRKTYFRIHDGAWTALLVHRMAVVGAFYDATARGLALLGDSRPQAQRRLVVLRDFYSFMAELVPELIQRWETHRKGELAG